MPWQFPSCFFFFLPQHSAMACLKQMPLTFIRLLGFQEVSYDSKLGMESLEAAPQRCQMTRKREHRICNKKKKEEWMRGEQVGQVFLTNGKQQMFQKSQYHCLNA